MQDSSESYSLNSSKFSIHTVEKELSKKETFYYFSQKRQCSNFILLFIYGIIFAAIICQIVFTFISHKYLNSIKYNSNLAENFQQYKQIKTQNISNIKKSKLNPIKFVDIAGLTEAKSELNEIINFLHNPIPYERIRARLPKALLLTGPPGSGKTMLGNAVATEVSIPFLYVSGLEFVEVYLSQGAKRIKQLFNSARSISPCIIFIDELDALGSRRHSSGNKEHEQILSQLLAELDGFNSTSGIIILAATSHIDSLDPALLRPGRIDKIIQIGLPDCNQRKDILNMFLKDISFRNSEIILDSLAKITTGFSGADLENLVNEAVLLATMKNQSWITDKELFEAQEKISIENNLNSIISLEQRNISAYHEAGHAIVAYYLNPLTDPIHKITIISRDNKINLFEQMPDNEFYDYTKSQLIAKLSVLMGGRAAEIITFGNNYIKNNNSNDIQIATNLAYKMVCEWGMSEKLGPLYYKNFNPDFFNKFNFSFSQTTKATIEKEVLLLISNAKVEAKHILHLHRKKLDIVAQALLENETINGLELKNLLESNIFKFPSFKSLFRF